MTPTACTFSPCGEPPARANRKMAPAVMREIPAPVLMARLRPARGLLDWRGRAEVLIGVLPGSHCARRESGRLLAALLARWQ